MSGQMNSIIRNIAIYGKSAEYVVEILHDIEAGPRDQAWVDTQEARLLGFIQGHIMRSPYPSEVDHAQDVTDLLLDQEVPSEETNSVNWMYDLADALD